MKSFVDSQPSGGERKTYALNGLEVTYTTVDMGAAKPFDYAVAAFVAPRDDGELATIDDYEIAVGSDVPEDLQGLWAWHELHDFDVVGHEAEDRCLTSEQEIAANMVSEPELYQRYLAVRIPFYEGLSNFIIQDLTQKGNESAYSASDLKGCKDAIEFLESHERVLNGSSADMQQKGLTVKAEKLSTSSLLDAAVARRAELDEQSRQKSEQEATDAEKKRREKEIEDERLAPERALSHQRAMEFIELMNKHGRKADKKAYINGQIVHHDRPRVGKHNELQTSRVETLLGDGWIVAHRRQVEVEFTYGDGGTKMVWAPALILLNDGNAYEATELSYIADENHHLHRPLGTVLVSSDRDKPRTATPLDAPFATDKGLQLLTDYIVANKLLSKEP
jgi:hypothetical protein